MQPIFEPLIQHDSMYHPVKRSLAPTTPSPFTLSHVNIDVHRPLKNELQMQSIPPSPSDQSFLLKTGAIVAAAMMLAGLIAGYAHPGPVTGALLPLGLTLWAIVGYIGRRSDATALQ